MRIAFFISSLGDTDLAKATITKLAEETSNNTLFVIPLTAVAATRTEDMVDHPQITRVTLDQITKQSDSLSKNTATEEELAHILNFVSDNAIQHACIGVPSSDNEIPFQIAHHLNIPTTIAYEYMFKPERHVIWNHIHKLTSNKHCNFAVPLPPASEHILSINPQAHIHEIGHLSIDRSQTVTTFNPSPVKQSLRINEEEEFIFISGTSQPTEVDNQFLNALLSEIATGRHPHLQLRMGLHPGIKDPDVYLNALLKTCEKFPEANSQFKILLTPQMEKRLQNAIGQNAFILRSDVSGSDAATAALGVAQAVPGALLNEAALKGKPVFVHDESAVPYLPKTWFANSISTFFKAKPTQAHSLQELGLQDTAPNLLGMIIKQGQP